MTEKPNRIAWVIGGGSGIGLASAEALAADGWTVILSARDEQAISEAGDAIVKQSHKAEAIALDISDYEQVERARDEIVAKHRRIDLLVNSAGFNKPKQKLEEMPLDNWRNAIGINLTGVAHCMRAVLPVMRGQRDGCIINMNSWAGRIILQTPDYGYTAAKHALLALTHSFNMEEFSNGIRACCIFPGDVATSARLRRNNPPSAETLAKMLQPEDIARTILFVANMPPRVCINEILISPTANRIFSLPN